METNKNSLEELKTRETIAMLAICGNGYLTQGEVDRALVALANVAQAAGKVLP